VKEMEELFEQYNAFSDGGKLIPLQNEIASVLCHCTLGHPGLIRFIFGQFRDNFRATALTRTISQKELFSFLLSQTLINAISSCKRLIVNPTDSSEIAILKELLHEPYAKDEPPSILFPKDKTEAAESLVRSGLLVLLDQKLTFAAPLMRHIFIHRYYSNSFESQPATLLEPFLHDVVGSFRPSILRNHLSTGFQGTPLESLWQKEFFHAASAKLKKHSFGVEVGKVFGLPGKIDFYVDNNLQWAIELLIDSGTLGTHSDSLNEAKAGQYTLLDIKESAVLNFTFKKPRRTTLEKYQNIWFFRYNKEDYKSAILYRFGNKEKVIQFLGDELTLSSSSFSSSSSSFSSSSSSSLPYSPPKADKKQSGEKIKKSGKKKSSKK